jgi:hypothetical protein
LLAVLLAVLLLARLDTDASLDPAVRAAEDAARDERPRTADARLEPRRPGVEPASESRALDTGIVGGPIRTRPDADGGRDVEVTEELPELGCFGGSPEGYPNVRFVEYIVYE